MYRRQNRMGKPTNRCEIQLDERHAMTRAPADAAPASSIVELLDAIPGAYERAQQGLLEIQAGQGVPPEEL